MSSSRQFTGGSQFTDPFECMVRDSMKVNELRNGIGAYELSYAKKGRSGFSFGGNQMDLAANSDSQKVFKEILMKAKDEQGRKIFPDEREINRKIMPLATKEQSPHALDAYKDRINQALASPQGIKLIDAAFDTEVRQKIQHVDKLIATIPDKETRQYLEAHPESRLRLVDYHNQYNMENKGKMHSFLQGNAVTIGDKHDTEKRHEKQLKEGQMPDLKVLDDFIAHTHYGLHNPKDVVRRSEGVVSAVKKNQDNDNDNVQTSTSTSTDTTSAPQFTPTPADYGASLKEAAKQRSYTIKPGDTFSEVALKYGIKQEELAAKNPELKNINQIAVGQKLQLPEFALQAPMTEMDKNYAKLRGIPLDELGHAKVQLEERIAAQRVNVSQGRHYG